MTSEASVGNQDDGDSDEEEKIDFTADSEDDTNDAVSNALSDATVGANDPPPPAFDLTADSPTIEEEDLQEAHLQGEPNDARSEGSAHDPDSGSTTPSSTVFRTAQRQLANYLQYPETSSTHAPCGALARQRAG